MWCESLLKKLVKEKTFIYYLKDRESESQWNWYEENQNWINNN